MDSIILSAMIGPEYKFLYVDDVGVNGGNSDREVWSKCELKNALEQNTLNVPIPTVLPGRKVPVLYVCTSDDAFPLSNYIMKPYPQ